METYTLRWSGDRSLYFVEPSRGRNVRGFWLGAEKKDFPVPPEMIRNPYSGAFAFPGYYRRWFSMRGFIVQQSDPQLKVPASAELVRDYLWASNPITLDTLDAENALAASAAETAAREAAEREAAGWAAVREAEAALDRIEKESGAHLSQEKTEPETAATSEPAPDTASPVATGGRPNKRDHRRGN